MSMKASLAMGRPFLIGDFMDDSKVTLFSAAKSSFA
jgi:hypothetical protein